MPPAPSTKQPTYDVQERVLCFHGPMLYEAKVLEIRKPDDKKDLPEYKVHYKGWKNTYFPPPFSAHPFASSPRLPLGPERRQLEARSLPLCPAR